MSRELVRGGAGMLVLLLAACAVHGGGADDAVPAGAAVPGPGEVAYPASVGDSVDPGNHAYWPVRVVRPERIEWSVVLGETPGMALPGADGSVCVVDGRGTLRFLDPASGATRCSVPGAAGHPNESSGMRGPDGTVYFGNHGFVQAVEANGEPLWRTELQAGALTRPPLLAPDGRALYVVGEELSCARLDAATGHVVWMRRDFVQPWSSMMIDDRGRFLMTTGKSVLHTETGPSKWWLTTVSKQIVSVGDRLVNIASRHAGCFSLAGRRPVVWSTKLPAEGRGLALGDDGDVRLTLANGDVARLDADGRIVWRRHVAAAGLGRPVTARGGETLAVDDTGVLHLVDAAGNALVHLDLGAVPSRWRPAVGPDGTIYVSLVDRLVKVGGSPPGAAR